LDTDEKPVTATCAFAGGLFFWAGLILTPDKLQSCGLTKVFAVDLVGEFSTREAAPDR
jgi:hypothetical protein